MPPVVVFIRHAEAQHNVNPPFNYHLRDPALSDQGFQQCKDLQDHLRQHDGELAERIELIVCSPFRRTLQTAITSLDWLIQRGVPLQPRAEWQENSAKPCDTGSDLSVIKSEYPSIDFSSVDQQYPSKTGSYAYTRQAVCERGRNALAWLRDRPESCIAVVSHSAFLRTGVVGMGFANADYRVFKVSDKPGAMDLVELSGEAGGMGRSFVGYRGIEPGDFEVEEEDSK